MTEFNDPVIDALVDDAIDVLCDRRLAEYRPAHPVGWRTNMRRILHDAHDTSAHGYAVADIEHNGRLTIEARMLADLLEPATTVPVPPPVPKTHRVTVAMTPAEVYARAEQVRREHQADEPAEWLPDETRRGYLAQARAAKARALEELAAARAATDPATPDPADGGTE